MAQRVVVLMEDDIDGGEAAETVAFGVDGASFEIDLSEKNASEFRDALAPYIAVARRSGRAPAAAKQQRRTPRADKVEEPQLDPKLVRAWAAENGIEVSARGRIKAEVVEQYQAAH